MNKSLIDKTEFWNAEELIRLLNNLAKDGRYVFRGFSKQDELLPIIIREKDDSKNESDFLVEFEKYGAAYFHATTPIDFMSYAQHFGIPTRLLDFSYNPFIALSFSIYASKGFNYKTEDDKDFYYILVADLSSNYLINKFSFERESVIGSSEQLDCLSDKSKIIIECISNENFSSYYHIKEFREINKFRGKILFIDPNKSNQRITMQQGLFMFPYSLDRNYHLRIIKENTTILKIHKSIRDELNDYLDTLGYNTYRLMPDLSSVCSAITKRIREKNKKVSLVKTIDLWLDK